MLRSAAMQPLHAKVHNGRLILDVPTDLPEGTVVELEPIDALDDMDTEEREALMRHLERSMQQAEQGLLIPAEEVLTSLRRRQG